MAHFSTSSGRNFVNIGVATTRSAKRYPNAIAVFDGDRELTWVELDERSNRLANLLTDELGLQAGERVAVLVPNRLEVVEIVAGVAKAGLVLVSLNFRLGDKDLDSILDNAEPRVLLVSSDLVALAERVVASRDIVIIDLDDRGPRGYESRLQGMHSNPSTRLHEVRPEDDFCIVYTSGTTGTPKGVWFDHARIIQHATVAIIEYEITSSSRYLVAIPHNSSINITLVPCLTVGAAVGFLDSRGFDPNDFLDEVRKRGVTHSFLVPTQLYRLLEQAPLDTSALDNMVTLGYGSAPMSPDKARQLVERFGPIFVQLYGMAEVASIGTMLRKQDHVLALDGLPHLFKSAGQPSYAMDVRVVDDGGQDVAPGQRGEVLFAAPYMMKGYFRDTERTNRTLVGGWIHSGDIAEVDSDGYIYIVDRKKDLIIRGGYNISPTEIEAVLHRHPAILEVAVIGVPDDHWGESILAVVVLKVDALASAEELLQWCRDDGSLTTVKLPEQVTFSSSLPKNAVGKIDKVVIRAAYWTAERKV